MVGMRGLGVRPVVPTLGGAQLPVMLRVALALGMATLLYGIVPHASVMPLDMLSLHDGRGSEVLLGWRWASWAAVVRRRGAGGPLDQSGNSAWAECRASIRRHRGRNRWASVLTMFAAWLFFLSGAHLGRCGVCASFDSPGGHAGVSGRPLIEAIIALASYARD